MANTAKYVGTLNGDNAAVLKSFIVTSGVTVTANDFVYFASGKVTNATVAGARLIGQAQSTVVGDGVLQVLVNVSPDAVYAMKNDNVGTTFAATHVGTYFDLIGATNAQLIDTSTTSATTGQMLCLEYAPDIAGGDITYGVFKIAEHAFLPLGS